ncbi:transcription termination/antitermination protein NusG [Sorangium sp. So ce887]|uniref:transcription termination/antitermination protein NusG n=1 Tax=Sorangium sp. So ce887 TaxID=3133324 RepID=UPI003F627DB6
MSHPSLHLTARDFDAYAAEKATSKAYSRPRLEVKQRALAWARGVVSRLGDLGISVDVHGSDEHPSIRNKHRADCQWVFFWRDQAARDELDRLLDRGRSISDAIDDPSPYTRHAFLALRISEGEVQVCFAVHPDAKVDVDNLRARLAATEEATGEPASPLAAELTSALHALPEQFSFGADGGDRVACSAATPDAIAEMLRRAADGQVPLWIGWSVPRETAVEHADILDEQLEDALVALTPIYRLVAWSRENDRIALDRKLEGIEQERARAHAEIEAENERWRSEQARARELSMEQARARGDERVEAALPARRPTLATLFKATSGAGGGRGGEPRPSPRHGGEGGAPARRAPHGEAEPQTKAEAPQKPQAEHAPRAQRGPSGEPDAAAKATPEPAKGGVLEKGSRVRVRRGPFGDKIGVVSELDGRGGARVLLGLLSTRLDLDELDLVADARDRPALSTSHRKPLAPTPRKAR